MTGSKRGFVRRAPGLWTWMEVRDALVDAAAFWRRSPGGGTSPFANDGPWQLMERESRRGDWDARGVDGTSSDVPLRPLPLSPEQVGRRDAASEWLALIEEPADRRIVVIAVGYLASGRARVPWRRIKRRLGVPLGEGGLQRRYERAITEICEALNGAEIRR